MCDGVYYYIVAVLSFTGFSGVPAWRLIINVSVQYNGGLLPDKILFKKNLNASKPSEHPPQMEECLKV